MFALCQMPHLIQPHRDSCLLSGSHQESLDYAIPK